MFGIADLTLVGVIFRLLWWAVPFILLVKPRWFFNYEERAPKFDSFESIPLWLVDKFPLMTEGVAESIFMVIRFVVIALLYVLVHMLIGTLFMM